MSGWSALRSPAGNKQTSECWTYRVRLTSGGGRFVRPTGDPFRTLMAGSVEAEPAADLNALTGPGTIALLAPHFKTDG